MAEQKPPPSDSGPSTRLAIGDGEFHVFLSHNSKDKNAIRRLKVLLEQRGIKCWMDEDELRPGLPWRKLLEDGIQKSKSVVIAVADSGLGPWEEEEMSAALELAVRHRKPVIPVLLPESRAKPDLPMFLSNRTWVDLRNGYADDGVNRLVWGITGEKPNRLVGNASDEADTQSKLWNGVGAIFSLILLAAVAIAVILHRINPVPKPPPDPPPNPPVVISIGIKEWVGYTPLAVAKQMNLFPKDIRVIFLKVNSATEVSERLGKGELQIGFLTVADLVMDADRIFKYRSKDQGRPVALFMIDTSRGADGFVARQGVNSIEDLVGMKFLYQDGDVSDFMLREYCSWTSENTNRPLNYAALIKNAQDQKPDAAADKFRNDTSSQYIAAGTYEPHLSQITQDIRGTKVVLDSKHPCVDGMIVDIAVAQDRFLLENKDAVRQLMIGWYLAVDLLNNTNGSTQADHELAVSYARRFNSRSKLDNWEIAEWPNYEQISMERYLDLIKGLAGDGTNPWPNARENDHFFKINGSTSSDTSSFHDVFDKWRTFLKKTGVNAKDFDGSDGLRGIAP